MNRLLAILLTILVLGASSDALAQIGGLLPHLPNVGNVVNDAANDAAHTVDRIPDPHDLLRARSEAVRNLLRRHHDVLEADPHGQPIVRGDILAIAVTAETLAEAQRLGFAIEERDDLGDLDMSVVVLRAPPAMSTRRALERLRQIDPAGVYDYNHLHLGAGEAPAAPIALAPVGARAGPRIGLIDGAVGAHPSLIHSIAAQRSFAGDTPVANAHATAVASLLAGQASDFRGAAPSAQLYVADVFGDVPTGGSTGAIVRALAWLATQNVPVINISLVGPRNLVMEAVIARLVARGFVIVAAVGNDGPAAPPLFPASYPGVVGVTGVDAHEHVLIEAGRGPQVDFAAPGADLNAAQGAAGYAPVRGTSFAAPIVAGLISLYLDAPNPARAADALQHVAATARDLGPPGRDDIYGQGLVGADVRVAARR
ncbi:MAG: S8 family serine peptidase [Pseudomonadota bacterium]